jgi:hypothetical protein
MTDAELDVALVPFDRRTVERPERRMGDADRRRLARWFPDEPPLAPPLVPR